MITVTRPLPLGVVSDITLEKAELSKDEKRILIYAKDSAGIPVCPVTFVGNDVSAEIFTVAIMRQLESYESFDGIKDVVKTLNAHKGATLKVKMAKDPYTDELGVVKEPIKPFWDATQF